MLDRCVAQRKYAAVAAALSFGGAPVAYPVAGVAAMLLVEDGRLALDQPVAEVFPALGKMRVAIDPAKGLESRAATRGLPTRIARVA